MSRRRAYARDPSMASATMPMRTVSMNAINTMACPLCFPLRFPTRWGSCPRAKRADWWGARTPFMTQYSVRYTTAAEMTTWLAVAWATIGVTKTRLKRMVTSICELPEAGLIALHDPLAIAAYSPPGALGGGALSTPPGGLGSVM